MQVVVVTTMERANLAALGLSEAINAVPELHIELAVIQPANSEEQRYQYPAGVEGTPMFLVRDWFQRYGEEVGDTASCYCSDDGTLLIDEDEKALFGGRESSPKQHAVLVPGPLLEINILIGADGFLLSEREYTLSALDDTLICRRGSIRDTAWDGRTELPDRVSLAANRARRLVQPGTLLRPQ